jgi:hypothetical protein
VLFEGVDQRAATVFHAARAIGHSGIARVREERSGRDRRAGGAADSDHMA